MKHFTMKHSFTFKFMEKNKVLIVYDIHKCGLQRLMSLHVLALRSSVFIGHRDQEAITPIILSDDTTLQWPWADTVHTVHVLLQHDTLWGEKNVSGGEKKKNHLIKKKKM